MKYLLYLHIFLGSVALVTFWLPVFTQKGSKVHRKIGWIYAYCMYGVVISAAILCIHNAIRGETNLALFLGFLSILSATPLWHGLAVLKNKRSMTRRYRTGRLLLDGSVVIFGLFLMFYGIFMIEEGIRVLFIFFGFIGLTSIRELRSVARSKPYSWYQDHYKGLITSGIAAYTAFLAFGGRQFLQDVLPGMWQVLPWILPTVVGVAAMRLTDRFYRRKGVIS